MSRFLNDTTDLFHSVSKGIRYRINLCLNPPFFRSFGGVLGSGCPLFVGGRISFRGFPRCSISFGGILGTGCPAVAGNRIDIPGFPLCVIGQVREKVFLLQEKLPTSCNWGN